MTIDQSILKILREQSGNCRVPQEISQVEKDECMLSFDNPFSPNGLYTNLRSWESYGRDFVEKDSRNSGHQVYLFQKFYKHYKLKTENEEPNDPKRLAIGVEGGFSGDDDKIEVEKTYFVCVLPSFTMIPLTETDLPLNVLNSASSIIAHAGIAPHEGVQAWVDQCVESKHSEGLVQLDQANVRVSPNPKDWKCAACGANSNLWLNLSDAFIGCGRRQPDGSGGCGAAAQHFEDTGRIYPLSVKLGTITPDGADVYSYDEDDMVKDSFLATHLSHWGIDIMSLKKTEKSMEELEIDINKKFVFGMITEDGRSLEKVSGASFIGLDNLGNSCYVNSLLQVVYSIPEIKKKYLDAADEILATAPENPASDLVTQAAKLAVGLLTDRYSQQTEGNDRFERERLEKLKEQAKEKNKNSTESKESDEKDKGVKNTALKPRMWKRMIGQGHPEFSTNHQQDAAEYMRHMFELVSRRERVSTRIDKSIPSLPALFRFEEEERLQCATSKQVRYSASEHLVLRLDISMADAINQKEVAEYEKNVQLRQAEKEKEKEKEKDKDKETDKEKEEKIPQNEERKVLPVIPFESCLQRYLGDSTVEDWLSPATGVRGEAIKSHRIATFPKYLAIQVCRYYFNDKWLPEKYDVEIPVPEEINLEFMRATGVQPNETLLPSEKSGKVSQGPQPDPTIVLSLLSMEMGFTENACKRAAIAVSNGSIEAATSWLFEHLSDENINDPLPTTSSSKDDSTNKSGPSTLALDESLVKGLCESLGFERQYVEVALRHTNGDSERAADWLFSHMDSLQESVSAMKAEQDAEKAASETSKDAKTKCVDGVGKYRLFGIVSHLGKATSHGHYVAHIKKGKQWYIFNDSNVAKSQDPPFKHGYVYFFERSEDTN